MIPKKCFFTKGVGVHKEKLASFELALRSAGLAYCNLVLVSSIYPPSCKRISREEGIKLIRPGEIVFCVYDRESTNYRSYQKKEGLSRQVRQARKGHPAPRKLDLLTWRSLRALREMSRLFGYG